VDKLLPKITFTLLDRVENSQPGNHNFFKCWYKNQNHYSCTRFNWPWCADSFKNLLPNAL